MIFFLYMAVGAVAGLLAGLLGIGGGLVIVPMLTFALASQVPPEYLLHVALGTSLASIICTSLSSLWAHHKRGAVLWPVVGRITPGILVGTFFGAWVASQLSTTFLKVFFGVFLLYVATQMLLSIRPNASRDLPGTVGIFGAGSVIGTFSSLVGIGGGTLSVPFLVWNNIAMHQAIGTSAAIGLPIALAGSAGYIVNGLMVSGLPAGTFGFVHLTALAGIVLTSVCTAPLGARLAHSLPVAKLKKIFSMLLYVVGLKMLWGSF
ncbi:sulfite exporter TauE/SafE family protein [Desulfotalea psychrophila]|uniref:Probable membrane transporter protein n=1 Tax=Desulfotalea psychrophila (strain LSv54 / DSM 12343) TaxID=177439 RepID=Q6ARB2_DESPS|nr:sulfite exporter TauE/SafE family protein [Desulfotalea psychrophila]CAG35112.1 conserved hypothetical membrane protein [Desulfotalea psychrophila LSv54]